MLDALASIVRSISRSASSSFKRRALPCGVSAKASRQRQVQ